MATSYKGKIEYDKIYDSSTRIGAIESIGRLIGLTEEEMSILMFAMLGNISDKPNDMELLKKIKIPAVPVKFDEDKVKRYARLLVNQLKDMQNYGVVDMKDNTIHKVSENGKWMTVFGIEVHPVLYNKIIHLLENNPQYILSVLYGTFTALGTILKFIEAEIK